MAKSGQHGGNTLQMAEKYGCVPEAITDFSANINPLGMPQSLRQAILEQLSCIERYPDIDYRRLHQAIARHHRCAESSIVAGNGATELIFQWVQQTNPGRALLVEPGFAEYRRALARQGCEIESFLLQQSEGFRLTERLLDALHPGLDCLFLCTPNNPTGLMPDETLLTAILHRCHELEIDLFVDESFLDFLPDRHGLIGMLDNFSNLFLLRSMTKFYAIPGLRLGYLLSSNQQVLIPLRESREPWTINAFAALAGEILFDDHPYAEQTYRWLESEQQCLYHGLTQIPQLTVYPPAANYIFFHLGLPGVDLQAALMQHRILIRHCGNYPGLDEQYYRVAIKSHEDNQRLLQALHEVFLRG